MNKSTFIQNAVITFMPSLEWDAKKALRYAEKLWIVLGEKGYGGKTEKTGPRVGFDHYAALPSKAKKQFDKFWQAFAYKHGKQGAARRWAELGGMDDDLVEKIYTAARKEAQVRESRGTTPPMAALWLSERRWQDWDADTQGDGKKGQEKAARSILLSELSHAKSMRDAGHSAEYWEQEIQKIEERLQDERKDRALS